MAFSAGVGRPLVEEFPEKILAYDVFQSCFVHHWKSWIDDRKADRIDVPIGRFDRHVQIADRLDKSWIQPAEYAAGNSKIDEQGRVTIPWYYIGRFKVLYVIGARRK